MYDVRVLPPTPPMENICIEGKNYSARVICYKYGLTMSELKHIEQLGHHTNGATFNLIEWYSETSSRRIANTF